MSVVSRVALALLVVVVGLLSVVTAAEDDKMTKYLKRTGEKWLKAKAAEPGVYTLPSGLQFKILTRGTGAKSPGPNDDCEVHYEGTLRTGAKFDSSYDRGSPATFKPTQVIKGWTEALQLMREGDVWEVYIPYELAYGAHGSPPKIPGYSPLQFKMELLKVKGGGKSSEKASDELKSKLGKSYEEL